MPTTESIVLATGMHLVREYQDLQILAKSNSRVWTPGQPSSRRLLPGRYKALRLGIMIMETITMNPDGTLTSLMLGTL
jgi:hypothetical protein